MQLLLREKIHVFSFVILKGLIATTLAGVPAPPEWTLPVERTFNFEYSTNAGCGEVVKLKATPFAGTGITFQVVSQGPETANFGTQPIDSTTARLTCDQAAVVNAGDKKYNVHVRAMDDVSQEFADIALVISSVLTTDVYTGPTFIFPNPDPTSDKHEINLEETKYGGNVVGWLSASDPDTAIALLQYSMTNSDEPTKKLFEIQGNALKVKPDVVEGAFDYENKQTVLQYPIVLEVTDSQSTATVSTKIIVTDINDNAPQFDKIENFNVRETTGPGSSVYQVIASDTDGTAPNNEFIFKMIGSRDFLIGETTGIISVAAGVTFNYDVTPKYPLTVKVLDKGIASLESQSVIEVSVLTAPVFVNLFQPKSVSMFDNATSDTEIFVLTVTDKDQAITELDVTIDSQTPEEKFQLDGLTLKPKPDATFDKAAQSQYEIKFKVNDGTITVRSAILTVTLTSEARVNPAMQRVISEDTPAGTQVARVSADDFSDPSKVKFSMNDGSSSDFVIDENNGRLTVATGVQLDYTREQSYTLIVTSTDGFSSAETPIIIFVKTSPIFVDPSINNPGSTSISIPENTVAKSVIKILTATDEDGDELDYDILRQIPETDKPVFEIIRTDDLIAARSNNADTFDVDATDAVLEYMLEIRVKDGRSVSVEDMINVTITITDTNEPPTFPSDITSEYDISETTQSGSTIFSVTATDNDRTPAYRKITYSISGTGDFAISEDTGDVSLAVGAVLNKTSTPTYTFTVIAADDGAPALSATVDITINVIHGCDILQDTYGSWPITEVNSTVIVKCDDLYEGNYTRVCYVNGTWGSVTASCKVKDTTLESLQAQLDAISNTSANASGEIESILESLSKITENQVDADVISNVTYILGGIVDIAGDTTNITDNSTLYFYETISNVLKPDNEEAFKQSDVDGGDILDVVDKYTILQQDGRCNNLNTGDVKEIENDYIYTEIGRKSGEVVFPNIKQSETSIDISENTLKNSGITNVCFGGAYYDSLGDIMEKQVIVEGSDNTLPVGEINSVIIALHLQTEPGISLDNLDPPVRINFTLKNGSYSNPVCVFWDKNITTGQNKKGAWSSEGCMLEEITNETAKCACSHLTNFAILMSPSKISAHHSLILGIISAVGCTISMICLVLTIIAHWIVWRVVRSNRTVTLMHLCVALLLAFGVFLAGVNRTESRVACVIIAALIQFLFLAVFFLMLFIGIEILLSVVQVFGNRFRLSRFLPLAWLAPLIIVGVSLGITKTEGYGNKEFCWLDINSGLIWSFIGPAAAIILVNVVIIAIVFKKMASATFVKSKSSSTKIKTWLHSLCVLLPMLGITWLFGLLSVNSDMFILQYFFSIFNSLQGLFIFLFHCVFNNQIRKALVSRKERRRTLASFESEIKNTTKEETSKSVDPIKKTNAVTRFKNDI